MQRLCFLILAAISVAGCGQRSAVSAKQEVNATSKDPLPSWNEGVNKKAIIAFVTHSVQEGGAGFIPESDRIACFDNDGTLWTEQPAYFQLLFALDEVKKQAPQHPEWQKKEPFAALLKGDMKGFMQSGEKGLMAVVMATHANTTASAFDASVKNWMATATHPKTGKHYYEMTYRPMVELLNYLRANGYKTFIVSGGGIDFMRPWAEAAYGIPPYQIVGSSGAVTYKVENGKPALYKLPNIHFVDDKEGKPVGIHRHIGKVPVFTAGNSDGDFAMLQYTTTAGGYPRFGLIVHHTDSVREYAYDRESHIGTLKKGLDSAAFYQWNIVDMQKDWNKIYAFE